MLHRRRFISYLGIGSYAMLRTPSLYATSEAKTPKAAIHKSLSFLPIRPSTTDELILAKGFHHYLLCKWNDPLGTNGPHGPEKFGYDNDYIAYLPIDALKGGKSSKEGLLWVNHESVTPLFVSDHKIKTPKTREQINREKLAVGGSILHIRRTNGKWQVVHGSKFNSRLCALYPEIGFSGPAAATLQAAQGTLANCSGGVTPWHTVLSCEENYQEFNPSEEYCAGWGQHADTAINEEHYGWVVEVDPFGELPPRKHTALGRFAHENAAVTIGASGKLVIYMGDDMADQFIYKFVSAQIFKGRRTRKSMAEVLEQGTLYVADLKNNRWLPLDLGLNPALRAAGFKTQGEVLINTRKAAAIVGGTPVDRPEDCEVHPKDGSIYVALTNNSEKNNHHGTILRIVEKDANAEAESFIYEIFLAGGESSSLSCPDNLMFDKHHNLWVTCDISTNKLNSGKYAIFGNNGLFMVPTSGDDAGKAFQFASGPNQAELTGPCFTPDGKTLFLSVQHPGQHSTDAANPTSRWPLGKDNIPHPAVVAIEGF